MAFYSGIVEGSKGQQNCALDSDLDCWFSALLANRVGNGYWHVDWDDGDSEHTVIAEHNLRLLEREETRAPDCDPVIVPSKTSSSITVCVKRNASDPVSIVLRKGRGDFGGFEDREVEFAVRLMDECAKETGQGRYHRETGACIFLDVGAQYGLYALHIAQSMRRISEDLPGWLQIRVFEPRSEAYNYLKESVRLNGFASATGLWLCQRNWSVAPSLCFI
eukprot:gnl/MRDRNA2_/MRDRNA2_65215_c0_seq2.p2 gnl/MRDRNA2_/MRDRNA2_65215_c0~~gnl/MRDRNA2_/MRDRNA2_65215_c0_seq2.p2  ORF type:complete len:234 (+),score=38.42 gnl/MRDRNA2_/MRDRNA2_65215_c0_seq2:44-703(+)